MEKFADIKAWLISAYNIHVSTDWLSACLEFIQQETNGSLGSFEQLRSLVFEQWRCSDLSEIGEPSLPAGIANTKKVDIVSSFPLQLVSIVDVGFSLYGQKQKLQRKDNPNVDVSADKSFQPAWEPKASRMLMMKLTDGHESIEAIEYRQIRTLHTNLPTGTKIAITGPLWCRRGVLLLCEENVQILGGEVDALIETSTPLSSLEAMMEKNRIDEGKSECLKLSGKFITRGSDEKDVKKFKSLIKQEQNVSSWSRSSERNSQRVGRSFTSHTKCETKMEYQNSDFKKEELHQTQEGNTDTDFQWEDDIDYDALFDDAMNSMDDVPSTTSVPTRPQALAMTSNNFKRENQEMSGHTGQTAVHSSKVSPDSSALKSRINRISAITPSNAVQSAFPVCKVEDPYFDDDLEAFDLDDIEDSFSPCTFSAAKSELVDSVGKTVNDQISDKTSDSKTWSALLMPPGIRASHTTNSSSSSSPLSQISKQINDEHTAATSTFSPPLMSPGIRASHPTNNSVSSSPLSQLSKQANEEQTATTSTFSQRQFGTSASGKALSSSSFSVQQKMSTQQASKRETTTCTSSASSNKRPLTSIQQPKKRAKQSKIYEWGFCSSIKDSNKGLQMTSQNENLGTLSETATDCIRSNSLKTSGSNLCFSSPCLGTNELEHTNITNDKDTVIISSLSTTSSVEFSSPKGRNLPKAIIHPFVDTDNEACGRNEETLPRRPFQYLSDLSNYDLGETVFVKAYISTLTDKLGCAGGQAWSLSCRINDGTACVDVDLDNKVLTELIGFSAQDSIIMRQRMKSDPSVKEVLMGGLTQCQNKLINISCLMKLVISSLGSKPVVTQFIPVASDHVQLLQRRVASLQHQ